MFDDSSGSSFTSQYKSIANKLKKRFLRKTNLTEPSDQFSALAVQCEKAELHECSGVSWLGVASCQSSLGHKSDEANAYANAARQFIAAENKTLIGCDVLSKTGEWCLGEARKIRELTDGTKVEGASEGYSGVALVAPLRAPDCLDTRLHDLGAAAEAQVSAGDYQRALQSFSQMASIVASVTSTPFGVYTDILVRCEVFRLLLVLTLSPSPQRLEPELATLVEKYTWIGEPHPPTKRLLGAELLMLLQSLVMSCQCQDVEAVGELEPQLSPLLSPLQRDLLAAIVSRASHSL